MQQQDDQRVSTGIVKTMAWSGAVLGISLGVAQGLLMGFIPPPSPNLSAQEIAQIFIDRKMGIRIGTLIECIGFTFYLTWGVSVVIFMRKMERGFPVLTYTALALTGGSYVYFLMMPFTWATLAFRPETLDPSTLQMFNDFSWFVFILSWPPFSLFMVLIAAAIFRDKNPVPIFPRWIAYLNLWCAVLIAPAGLISFFKTGPFAYDGIIDFWFVWPVFLVWVYAMIFAVHRACNVEKRRQIAEDALSADGASEPYERHPA